MCEYLRAATSLQEDTKRWEEDGKDDLENVAASERHLDELVCCVRECVCSLCDNEKMLEMMGDGWQQFPATEADGYIEVEGKRGWERVA